MLFCVDTDSRRFSHRARVDMTKVVPLSEGSLESSGRSAEKQFAKLLTTNNQPAQAEASAALKDA